MVSSYQYAGQASRPHPLNGINIQIWTDVQIASEYAAAAISLYLETEHPVIARFDSDLFIRDLTSGRTENCSSLLVNALLAHAMVGDSLAHWCYAVNRSIDSVRFCGSQRNSAQPHVPAQGRCFMDEATGFEFYSGDSSLAASDFRWRNAWPR